MSISKIIAVGYGRTSSENLGSAETAKEKVSVSVQQSEFETACSKNGWTNGGFYSDRDITGRSYPAGASIAQFDFVTQEYIANKSASKQYRKALAEALQQAAKVGASILWAREESRFYRPLSGSMLAAYLRGELARLNLTLWSGEAGKIDFKNFSTNIVQNLQNEIKSHDIEVKTQNSIKSKNKMRDDGYATSDVNCYGWKQSGKQQVIPVPEEQAVILRIFREYLSGKTISAICHDLGRDRIPTDKGGTWIRATLRKILKRAAYAGLSYTTQGDLINSKVYAPIITKADFLKAQDRLGNSKRTEGSRENKLCHPLSGYVKCGVCGHVMRPHHSQQTVKGVKYVAHYYLCHYCDTNHQGRNMIRETVGVPATVSQATGYLSERKESSYGVGLLEALEPFVIPGLILTLKAKASKSDILAHATEAKATLEGIREKQAKRYLDMENGLLDADTYATISKSLMDQKAKAEKDLKNYNAQIAELDGMTITSDDVAKLQNVSAKEYSQLVRQSLKSVVVYSDKIEVFTQTKKITLPRIRKSHANLLPKPTVHFQIDGGEIIKSGSVEKVVRKGSTEVCNDVLVRYGVENPITLKIDAEGNVIQL